MSKHAAMSDGKVGASSAAASAAAAAALRAFAAYKRGVLRALDRSPKGSVDAAAQPIVDLLNACQGVVTLSSCAGRTTNRKPDETVRADSPAAQ